MEVPRTTEALTKLLRSKDISTGQICELVSKLDQLRLYFPNKEHFILELIIDRWNDQKLAEYKKDVKIWKLFNEMWTALADEVILKRLLKKLRFVPNLIQTLQIIDSDFTASLQTIKETCALINSLTTLEVSVDNANSILGRAIELVLQVPKEEQDTELGFTFMDEIITLVDIQNMSEVFGKSTANYCNQLLLPSLRYFTEFKDGNDTTTALLTELLGSFVFGKSVDTIKLLDKFVQGKGSQLSPQNCSELFSKCILFLSKEHFKELEKIFSIVTRVHPELSSVLLKELSLSKKTLSENFLQGLFDDTIDAAQQKITDHELWQLIYYILTLDIEIGVKNSSQLLTLISKGRDQSADWSVKAWSELIKCHRNARELPQFFEALVSYCRQNSSSTFLITDDRFAHLISDCSTSFSSTQLKGKLAEILKALGENSADSINAQLLIVLLKGLPNLSYTALTDYRDILRGVFEVKLDDQKICWIARYLTMDIYDDLIPEEMLKSPEKQIDAFSLSHETPIELYYYLFKLREHKTFSMLPVIPPFMEKISSVSVKEQASILRIVFNNWSTILNSLFPQTELKVLVEMLFTIDNLKILNNILDNDDTFEEQEILHIIVRFISQSYQNKDIIKVLLKIPIQCITKSIRIDLINKISQKADATEIDMQILVHMLKNATFKSDIEKDWKSLEKFAAQNMKSLSYQNSVFETIWLNHMLQTTESVSKAFIQQAIASLCERLSGEKFEPASFQIAFLILRSNTNDESRQLQGIYVAKAVKLLVEGTVDEDCKVTAWLLRTLYYIVNGQDCDQELPSKDALSTFIKAKFSGFETTDHDLLVSMFLLYSMLYSTELEYLYAQYMVLRAAGIESALLWPGVETAAQSSIKRDIQTFNRAFVSTFESFETCSPELIEGLLELYQLQVNLLDKDNTAAGSLFLKSLSNFYTHCSKFTGCVDAVSKTLNCIGELLISKGWIFSQYCIEMLFPLSLQLNSVFMGCTADSDQIFITTAKIISNVLFTQRIKLSNRHHIIITYLCEGLELLAAYKDTQLTSDSAKSLARLISNLCEPNISQAKQTNSKNILNSKTSEVKSSLRKHVPLLLVKYIHLSVNSPFDPRTRNELTPAVYSVFDLLSQDGVGLINSALDYAGRQYLRGLYADYKKTGKWHAD